MNTPEQQAVALGYQPGTPAPKVLSQGRGLMAQAIVDRARELGIPTRSEPALVEFLMQLDINAWVPPEMYAAVAQVLAWAYEVDGKPVPFSTEINPSSQNISSAPLTNKKRPGKDFG